MTRPRIDPSAREETGASAVEYGLLIAGIAGLIVAMVFLFGDAVQGLFTQTCTAISNGGSTHVAVGSCS